MQRTVNLLAHVLGRNKSAGTWKEREPKLGDLRQLPDVLMSTKTANYSMLGEGERDQMHLVSTLHVVLVIKKLRRF